MRTQNRTPRIPVRSTPAVLALFAVCLTALAQQPAPAKPASPPTMASMMEAQLNMVEGQFLAAAEAMPEDKYSSAPAGADFSGVRTFALEVRHVATANFIIYSGILGQDPPAGVTVAGAGNGPENLRTKEQIVQYLKDSFTLGHKAMAALNNGNALTPLDKPPIAIPSLSTRLALAIFSFSHASDHYGQMVEYLRMNSIVPPASVGQPPANPPAK
jgi:DinB superfamily